MAASVTEPPGHDRLVAWKREGLDLVEVRSDLSKTPHPVEAWGCPHAALPLLFTTRSVRQGGQDRRPAHERMHQIFVAGEIFDGVDLELTLPPDGLRRMASVLTRSHCLVVASAHYHSRMPQRRTLEQALERAREIKADVVKIAARVDTPKELGALAKFLGDHQGGNLAVLGMGRYGKLSRALFPSLGSVITFAHVGTPTADGQMGLEETRRLCSLVQASGS